MSTLRDVFAIGLGLIFSLIVTGGFIAWMTVLPSIGLFWLAGWLK